jgi:hypothetical protein
MREEPMDWKKLSEESPPEEGFYLTYNPTENETYNIFCIEPWSEQHMTGELGFWGTAINVTHWAFLEAPE